MFGQTGFKMIWQSMAILVIAVLLGLSINQLRSGKLPLVGDWSPEAGLQTDSGSSLSITIEEAEALYFSQSAIFLDARSRELYEAGHIEGALSLPWEEFDGRYADLEPHISADAAIITYCDGESCSLSKELALALLRKGYSNVRVLVNGWTLWQWSGLPVESGLAATPRGDLNTSARM